MKRCIGWILSLLTLVISLAGCYRLQIPRHTDVVLRYAHKETQQSFSLIDEEAWMIRKHLNAATYLRVGAGCAFKNGSEYGYMYSLIADDRVIAIANDDHHTLWDVEQDRYYEMTEEGWSYLTDLFCQHLGVTEFPYWGSLEE